jgi:hypothetical protein
MVPPKDGFTHLFWCYFYVPICIQYLIKSNKLIICVHFTMFPPWAMVRNKYFYFFNHKILQIHKGKKKTFKLITRNTNQVHNKHQFDELFYYCFLCMDTKCSSFVLLLSCDMGGKGWWRGGKMLASSIVVASSAFVCERENMLKFCFELTQQTPKSWSEGNERNGFPNYSSQP